MVFYQIYQLGTGRHTQKAQACTRCLLIAKEPRSKENLKQQIGWDKSYTEKTYSKAKLEPQAIEAYSHTID